MHKAPCWQCEHHPGQKRFRCPRSHKDVRSANTPRFCNHFSQCQPLELEPVPPPAPIKPRLVASNPLPQPTQKPVPILNLEICNDNRDPF